MTMMRWRVRLLWYYSKGGGGSGDDGDDGGGDGDECVGAAYDECLPPTRF